MDNCTSLLLMDQSTRVTVVMLTSTVEEARRRHDASAAATVVLGRAMVAASLLTGMVHRSGRINLQLAGNGPVGTVVVDANGLGEVRGYVRRPSVPYPVSTSQRVNVADVVGREGFLNLLLDPTGSSLSRGTTQIVSGEVDEDVEECLVNSSQLFCAVGTDVLLADHNGTVKMAAGILVQGMPGGDVQQVKQAQQRLRGGGMFKLMETGPISHPEELARRLFPEEQFEVLENRPLSWQCHCSRDRVLAAVSTLGVESVANMLVEDGRVEATCDFCRNRYVLSGDDLTALLAEMEAADRGGPEIA